MSSNEMPLAQLVEANLGFLTAAIRENGLPGDSVGGRLYLRLPGELDRKAVIAQLEAKLDTNDLSRLLACLYLLGILVDKDNPIASPDRLVARLVEADDFRVRDLAAKILIASDASAPLLGSVLLRELRASKAVKRGDLEATRLIEFWNRLALLASRDSWEPLRTVMRLIYFDLDILKGTRSNYGRIWFASKVSCFGDSVLTPALNETIGANIGWLKQQLHSEDAVDQAVAATIIHLCGPCAIADLLPLLVQVVLARLPEAESSPAARRAVENGCAAIAQLLPFRTTPGVDDKKAVVQAAKVTEALFFVLETGGYWQRYEAALALKMACVSEWSGAYSERLLAAFRKELTAEDSNKAKDANEESQSIEVAIINVFVELHELGVDHLEVVGGLALKHRNMRYLIGALRRAKKLNYLRMIFRLQCETAWLNLLDGLGTERADLEPFASELEALYTQPRLSVELKLRAMKALALIGKLTDPTLVEPFLVQSNLRTALLAFDVLRSFPTNGSSVDPQGDKVAVARRHLASGKAKPEVITEFYRWLRRSSVPMSPGYDLWFIMTRG